MRNQNFNYICATHESEHQIGLTPVFIYVATLASRVSLIGFLFYGSSQILPKPPSSDYGLNRNLPYYQYVNKPSVGNDVPESTYDLQDFLKKKFLLLTQLRDMQER